MLVAAGTYTENITWPATNGIQLIGEDRETTIIDGNQQASVIRFTSSNIDTTTLISDFTITNGYAQGYSQNSSGGGIYCIYSSPSLVDVTIMGNSANSRGGGIYCSNHSSPSLENVTISNNSASFGGGIYCDDSSPSFSSENRCNIYSNNVQSRERGADIYSYECDMINVIVDTFTAMTPTDYHASPLDNFTFDILNAVNPQVDADLYVSPDGDNSNDGLTAETPLKTIQYATSLLADSTYPHTIHLANGIYSPSTNGEFFPVEVITYVSLVGESEEGVILDAEGVAGVMKCMSVASSTISHLTLTNGSASSGGGIYLDGSYPSLENVTITNNSASSGGGIYCKDYSSPSLVDVTLSNNSADHRGGGIYCEWNSSPSLVDVTIMGNSASDGGGIYCKYYSSPSLENVTISNNSAYSSGGGIWCEESSPSLANVTLSNNSAYYGGGIYCCRYSSPSLVNCILWNDAPQEVYFYGGYDPVSIMIACSDIQGGEAGIVTNDNGTVPVSIMIAYSDIQGGETGIVTNDNGTVYWEEGNMGADPLFVDAATGDYHLTENSPCVGTGKNGKNMGALGVGCEAQDLLGD